MASPAARVAHDVRELVTSELTDGLSVQVHGLSEEMRHRGFDRFFHSVVSLLNCRAPLPEQRAGDATHPKVERLVEPAAYS